MDEIVADPHSRGQQIKALIENQSTTDFAHLVNHAYVGLDQQAQNIRDSAVVEAQLHLSTIIGEDVGKSSFERQATFSKARHVVGGIVKSSQITTCFENGTQSRQYLQTLNTYDAERERRDDTIPTYPEHKRALVGILVQAFKSTAIANDKAKYLETFADKKYDNRLVEARCWQILEFCIERSKRQSLLRLWGGDKTKSEGTHVRDIKFADRFDGIVKVLSTWKKSCDRVYQAPFIPQLVDNPDWATKQTINNAMSNDRKAVLLDIAKQAEEDIVEQCSSPATTPSPTKRRKTTSTPSSSRRGSIRTPLSGQLADRAPPPGLPSVPQLSVYQSLPSIDDFAPSFRDLYHSTSSSPTKDQQYTSQTSPHPFSSPRTGSRLPIESAALSHDSDISSPHQRSDAGIFDGSNTALNAVTMYNTSPNTPINRLPNTANFEPLLSLGSWRNGPTTAIPPTNTTPTASNAELGANEPGDGYPDTGYNRHSTNVSRRHVPRTAAVRDPNEQQAFHQYYYNGLDTEYNTHEVDTNTSTQLLSMSFADQQDAAFLQDGTRMEPRLGPRNQQTNISIGDLDLMQSEWTWHDDGTTFPDEYWQ